MFKDRLVDYDDLVYIHMEYYPDIWNNQIMEFTVTWMELENIMLNEESQKKYKGWGHIKLMSWITRWGATVFKGGTF